MSNVAGIVSNMEEKICKETEMRNINGRNENFVNKLKREKAAKITIEDMTSETVHLNSNK